MRLGTFWFAWPKDITLSQGIWGAKVGVLELWKALLIFSDKVEGIDLFLHPCEIESWKNLIPQLHRRGIPTHRLNLRCLFDLPKALLSEDFLAFHADLPQFPLLLCLRFLKFKSGFPLTLLAHAISDFSLFLQLLAALSLKPQPFDVVICTSRAQRDALKSLFSYLKGFVPSCQWNEETNLALIPLGVDVRRFRPRPQKECRQILHLPEEGIIFLSVGRFSCSGKADLLPLLRLFQQLLKTCPRAWLLLGGEPSPYGNQLRQFAQQMGIEDKIIIFSPIPEEIKPLVYNSADVFVTASDNIQESFGLALLEAMASGLAVVAPDWDGFRDIVTPKTGFLIPTYWHCEGRNSLTAPFAPYETVRFLFAQGMAWDWEEMIENLIFLAKNQDFREEMGRNARKRVEENFSWETVIPRYEDLWIKLKGMAKSTTPPDLPFLDYQKIFKPYPSCSLKPSAITIPTRLADEVKNGEVELIVYDELKPLLYRKVLEKLIERVSDGEETLGNLLNLGGEIERHLLWLAKQGVIRIVSPGNA